MRNQKPSLGSGWIRDPGSRRLVRESDLNCGTTIPNQTAMDLPSTSSTTIPVQTARDLPSTSSTTIPMQTAWNLPSTSTTIRKSEHKGQSVPCMTDIFLKNQYGGYSTARKKADFFSLTLKRFAFNMKSSLPFMFDVRGMNPKVDLIISGKNHIYGRWEGVFKDREGYETNWDFYSRFNFTLHLEHDDDELDVDSDKSVDITEFDYQRFYLTNPEEHIVDMCAGYFSENFILSIANTDSGHGIGHVKRISTSNAYEGKFRFYGTMFCCASNPIYEKFYIGVEDQIIVRTFNVEIDSINSTGTVRSLAVNDNGNVVYAGLHNGSLEVHDTRDSKPFIKNFHSQGINDIYSMKREPYVICKTFDGKLFLVDERKYQIYTEFLECCGGFKRRPVSVNEEFEILCDTGEDNVIKLWTLNGGSPIKKISPYDVYYYSNCSQIHGNSVMRGILFEQNRCLGVAAFCNENSYSFKIM